MNLGRNAIVVITVSLVLTLGSIFYIRSQVEDQSRGRGDGAIGGFMMLSDRHRTFVRSIRMGSYDDVSRILSDDPALANEKIPGYGTGLHLAAAMNHVEITRLLVDRGADIKSRGQWGGTPLHMAAWLGSPGTVQLLIQRGADCETRCEAFTATPLLWAAYGSSNDVNPAGDYVETCRLLIDAGAKADTSNKNGESAAGFASPDLRQFLLAHGAKPPPAATQPAENTQAQVPAGP